MGFEKSIVQALEYIEDNLKNDISVADVARIAGYSEYHFIYLFRKAVFLTPGDYIRKRRISEIVRCMVQEDRPISEIAFDYGFNSGENFIRAFKKEHHILPTEFRRAKNSLRLYGPLKPELICFRPKVQIVTLDAFEAVVYRCDEEFPPNFWNKYNARGWSKRLSGGKTVEDIGFSLLNDQTKRLEYRAGIRREDARGDLSGTETILIPGGKYAMFQTPPATQFSFVSTIRQTWEYITTVWIPAGNYERISGFEFECYVEESRSFSERIYIPVRRRRHGSRGPAVRTCRIGAGLKVKCVETIARARIEAYRKGDRFETTEGGI